MMLLPRTAKNLTQFLFRFAFSTSSSDSTSQISQPKPNNKGGSLVRKASNVRLEKVNKQLKEFARSAFEENNSAESVEFKLKTMNPMNVYKQMDTSVEGFFQKRPYNLKNFNFLLQALAEKSDLKSAMNVLDLIISNKMFDFVVKEMQIQGDSYTYNSMIKVCCKTRDMQKAEEYFEKSVQKFGVNLFNYNSLLIGYARNTNVKEAERIVKEMTEKGLQLDAPIFTTLINANYKSRNLKRCWDIYRDLEKKSPHLIDIPMTSLMIEIAAHVNKIISMFFFEKYPLFVKTRDAEQGKLLWEKLDKNEQFFPNTIHCNNIIKCLGSRSDYADEAIEHWQRMKEMGIQPDQDTFVALFKACSLAGDVKTAFDGLQVMKLNKIPLNKYILTAAIKVYAGVIKSEYMTNDLIDMYISDAWSLFKHAVEERMVDVHIINSLLSVHVKALKEDDIDGLVLPLYEKYAIKKNSETFENLLEMFHEKRDLPKIYKMHGWLKSENLEETWKVLNYVFDAAYRAEDVAVMCETLKKFLDVKKEPKTIYLKRLGENRSTPDQIYVLLTKFPSKFGYVADPNFKPAPTTKHSLQGLNRQNNKQK